MELFQTLEDKLTYVKTLTLLATTNEKITDTQKTFVYNIVKNYNLPEEYVEEIWQSLRRKSTIEDILEPIKEKSDDYKMLLLQELVMIFLVSDTYIARKPLLLSVCRILDINIKLSAIKDHVQKYIQNMTK